MLFQRLAKDYDGARTIVIYFIPAVMAVYWLNRIHKKRKHYIDNKMRPKHPNP
jgi:hypothetical protein